MKGVRSRFTDRLDEFEESLRLAMDQMDRSNRDLVLGQAALAKNVINIINEVLPRLLERKDLLEREQSWEQWNLEYTKECVKRVEEYLALPWYKRLFRMTPVAPFLHEHD